MHIDDLKATIEHGCSIEDPAEFPCRASSTDDVARGSDLRLIRELDHVHRRRVTPFFA
jgi:hypothetical protein